MSGFENYAREALDLEREIIRHGIALGIDWNDPQAVRQLARAALAHPAVTSIPAGDRQALAREELFGLINLMLRVMAESAGNGIETHGGAVWKTLARALWAERG
jgi:hypothetical protein